jgi:hypothetical protein
MIVFHLFNQNERVFRDQNLVIEMQQSARAVASQISDEIRMAGQGVPIYASSFDNGETEATATILSSSNSNRIDFRSGLSNAETNVTTPPPIDFSLNVSRTITVADGKLFSSGDFVYLWGPATDSPWTWVRAELIQVTSNTMTLIPRQSGGAMIRFASPPTLSLEEAVSIYISGTVVKRATAANMTNAASPTWSAANEIGRNFTKLEFTYFDRNGDLVLPTSLSNRISIARVDVRLVAQTATALSNGIRPSYSISVRTIPRNMKVH